MQFDFWEPFESIFQFFNIFFIIVPIFIIVIIIIVVVGVFRAGTSMSREIARGFTVEAPSFVIPDRYRDRTRSDGSQMTTVRLPERCPSCGASLSHEGIDWVGPLEAKCSYCGGTVRANFERL